ncbi:hypothetical protein E2C01_083724 [Portunus trituberculatus]|uniref:Uncharacterized protein n=1 Tax=Portunus trituberculatus TaxID=210409 RepID=A0A5B7J2Y6_PORTR|nr:hypothetical protein [Portunus trituberculatus]
MERETEAHFSDSYAADKGGMEGRSKEAYKGKYLKGGRRGRGKVRMTQTKCEDAIHYSSSTSPGVCDKAGSMREGQSKRG